MELLGIRAERISVVYPAADSRFAPLGAEETWRFRKERLDGRPYVLNVGTLEPRKNADVLIRAFADIRQELDLPHLLVFVGGRGWMFDSLFDLVRELGVQDAVRFQGPVAPEELPLWYNAADLFAYPSVYEGFGLPVLEAMACGVPTITTQSSSLAEVAGSACLTVEPGSQEALGAAMQQLLGSVDLRNALRMAGLVRAAEFSWERTATHTVQVYEKVAEA
jgi:glycosyltransferase involved in cell wall biosynthesis